MTNYTYCNGIFLRWVNGQTDSCWTTNEAGDRILEPMSSKIETCIFGVEKPHLIFQENGSISFPRLKRTITPNSTTRVEIFTTDQRGRGRKLMGMCDLVILHNDESYYVVSGGDGESFSNKGIARLRREVSEIVRQMTGNECIDSFSQSEIGRHHTALLVKSEVLRRGMFFPFAEIIIVIGGFALFFGFLCFLLTLGQPSTPPEPNSIPTAVMASIMTVIGTVIFSGGFFIRRAIRSSNTKLEKTLNEKYGLSQSSSSVTEDQLK